MNIHEHQAKQILKKYGAIVPDGVFAFNVDELIEKAKVLKTEKYVLKAQIHAGGRGKAGGVKILNSIEELKVAAKELLGKTLVTHQTGPEGREVKRLYVEESSNIDKEFYLSCLVDRASSKIAFISSDQGGMDIEEVASSSPEKIITTKVDMSDEISNLDCEKIIKIFNLNEIDVFAFENNQNSYTATRITASYLKGISSALKKPLISIEGNLEHDLDIEDLLITAKDKFLSDDVNNNRFDPKNANPIYNDDIKFKKLDE